MAPHGSFVTVETVLQTTLHRTGSKDALMRGANILMPILTPTRYREHYQLFEGRVCLDESASQGAARHVCRRYFNAC